MRRGLYTRKRMQAYSVIANNVDGEWQFADTKARLEPIQEDFKRFLILSIRHTEPGQIGHYELSPSAALRLWVEVPPLNIDDDGVRIFFPYKNGGYWVTVYVREEVEGPSFAVYDCNDSKIRIPYRY